MALMQMLICGMKCMDCEEDEQEPLLELPTPILMSYDSILEDRLRREIVYLLLDRETYANNKCDINLLELYEQEVRVRTTAIYLLRHKQCLDSQWDGHLQWLWSERSRYEYLAEELYESRVRRSPAALARRRQTRDIAS